MSFPADNTSVIRMKRDFEQYLKDHDDSRLPAFSLDDDTNYGSSFREESEAIAIHSLLGNGNNF